MWTQIKKLILYTLTFPLFFSSFIELSGQITFPVNDIRDPEHSLIVLRNLNIHQSSDRTAIKGDILIENGIIRQMSSIPIQIAGAQIIELDSMHIYPSFIEPLCSYGIGEPKTTAPSTNTMLSSQEGPYSWNEAIRTTVHADGMFKVNADQAKMWREAGYSVVNTHYPDGISRGSSCIVSLEEINEHQVILTPEASHVLSLNKGMSSQEYPGSLMGAIALIRQTYYDGQQYVKTILPKEYNLSLVGWNSLQQMPQIFIAQDKLDILRIQKLATEFNKKYFIVGTGDEYQRASEIQKSNASLILPINFPKAYTLDGPFDANRINLGDLKHWEMAPFNPSILASYHIPFVFTSAGLQNKSDLVKNIRLAISKGLSPELALYALTEGPARIFGIWDKVGSLDIGKQANFIVTTGPLFDEQTKIIENWTRGDRYILKQLEKEPASFPYSLIIGNTPYGIHLFNQDGNLRVECKTPDTLTRIIMRADGSTISGSLVSADKKNYLFTLTQKDGLWSGTALSPEGTWVPANMSLAADIPLPSPKAKQNPNKKDSLTDLSIPRPFMAFGWKERPQQSNFLIKNATIWTCENTGVLEKADIAISSGKIKAIGKNLNQAGYIVIDASGKHVSPGIIDEHSHIAISGGVNECTQSNTAEVRIGDVVNSDDINIYRLLSGGVTSSQLLHGSCNPIGGQSALIKLKWGFAPEEMQYGGTDGFIKFALGENVKRSGSQANNRYPDSRMGVEQVYIDAFTRAQAYKEQRAKDPSMVRKDLELDALTEILDKKRFITCHSYVQSEINMLMHVATRFGFRVNTFTHILEGYKVADKMKAHGAGASSFSDWWAYKFEVYEAIPYNGAILHNEGVITAFNSDDAEMARRLNQEAAKAVKYGGVSETEALKFVTLNPAKLLHIDSRTGSLREGKDADIVIWSENPLSDFAVAEKTFVDGMLLFDRVQDKRLREEVRAERGRLIQKLLKAKEEGSPSATFQSKKQLYYHCDTVGDQEEE